MDENQNDFKGKKINGIRLNTMPTAIKVVLASVIGTIGIGGAIALFPAIGAFGGFGLLGGGLGAFNGWSSVLAYAANGIAFGGGGVLIVDGVAKLATNQVQWARYKHRFKKVAKLKPSAEEKVVINGIETNITKDRAYRQTEEMINSVLLPEVTSGPSSKNSLIARIKNDRDRLDYRKTGLKKPNIFKRYGLHERAIANEDYVKAVIKSLIERLAEISKHEELEKKGSAHAWKESIKGGGEVSINKQLRKQEATNIRNFLANILNQCEASDPFVKTVIHEVNKYRKYINIAEPNSALNNSAHELLAVGKTKRAVYNTFGYELPEGLAASELHEAFMGSTELKGAKTARIEAERLARETKNFRDTAKSAAENASKNAEKVQEILDRLTEQEKSFQDQYTEFLNTLKKNFSEELTKFFEQPKEDAKELRDFVSSKDFEKLKNSPHLLSEISRMYKKLTDEHKEMTQTYNEMKNFTGRDKTTENDLADMKSKLDDLGRKIEELRQQSNGRDDKILKEYRDKHSQLKSAFEQMKAKQEQQGKDIEHIKKEIEKINGDILTQTKNVENGLQANYNTLLNLVTQAINLSASNKLELQDEINKITLNVKKIIRALAKSKKTENQITAELTFQSGDIDKLKETLKLLEDNLGDDYENCIKFLNDISATQEKQAQQISKIQNYIQKLVSDSTTYSTRIANLNKRASSIEQRSAQAKELSKRDKKQLQDDIDTLRKATASNYKYILGYIKTVKKFLGTKVKVSEDRIKVISDNINNAINEFNIFVENQQKLEIEFCYQSADIEALHDEIEELSSYLPISDKIISRLAQLEQKQAELETKKTFETDQELKALRKKFENYAIAIYTETPLEQASSAKRTTTTKANKSLDGQPVKTPSIDFEKMQKSDKFKDFLRQRLFIDEYNECEGFINTSYKKLNKEELKRFLELIDKAYHELPAPEIVIVSEDLGIEP